MWLFVAIVALSLLFSVSFLQAIEFKADEATSLFLATRPLFGHPFLPAASSSSFGILNPPLFLYLLFPFSLFSADPRFVSAVIGTSNAVTVGLFFLLFKRYYGKPVALIASLFLAVSPWAILYSRKIWAQDFILPLSFPLFYAFHKILFDKDARYWLLYALSTMLLLQIHQSLLFFLIPLTIFLLLARPKMSIRRLCFGIVLGIIPAIPWVLFELTHELPSLTGLIHASERGSNIAIITQLLRPLQILHTGNWFSLMGADIAEFAARNPLLFRLRLIFYLYYPLLLFGMVVFWQKYKSSRSILYATLCLPILYVLFRIPPHMHYFIVLLPLLFLFTATGIVLLYQKFSFAKLLLLGTVGVSIVFLLFFNLTFFQFAEEKGNLSGDYGTTYAANEKLAKAPLEQYKHSKEYREMLLATYMPLGWLRGDTPIAKMLYDPKATEKRLSLLEKRLKAVPEDARIKHELLAYYTTAAPTDKTLLLLRQKRKDISAYEPIYAIAYSMHLEKTLRKAIEDPILGVSFEYPQHWDMQKGKNQTVIKGDGFILSLQSVKDSCTFENCLEETGMLLGQTVQKTICITNNNIWCGTTYGPIQNNTLQFFIAYKPEKKNNILITNKDYAKATVLLKSVLSTMRKL